MRNLTPNELKDDDDDDDADDDDDDDDNDDDDDLLAQVTFDFEKVKSHCEVLTIKKRFVLEKQLANVDCA